MKMDNWVHNPCKNLALQVYKLVNVCITHEVFFKNKKQNECSSISALPSNSVRYVLLHAKKLRCSA